MNTPTLSNGSGDVNEFYIVTKAGTTTIDGISSWGVGDWIISNGTKWEKIPASDIVVSVNGKTGAVNLASTDLTDTDKLTYDNADGIPEFNNSCWKDLIIQAGNLRTGATPPSFGVFSGVLYQVRFDNGTEDVVYGSFELQHDYKEGTNLKVHVHWSPSNTDAGNIQWGFDYAVANANGAFSAVTSLTITPVAGGGTANVHKLSTLGTIPGTGRKIGDIITFRLYRSATDTFGGNAFLHSVGVHYEADTPGSHAETSK